MKTISTFILFLGTYITLAQHPITEEYNVYYGHLHNHTAYSDGEGDPWEAYDYARQQAGLDFLGIADHVELLSKKEYTKIKKAANEKTVDGKFVAFYGFEWSSLRFGHVAVINSDDKFGSGLYLFSSFKKLLRKVNKRNCVAFLNHPGREDRFGSEFSHFKKGYSEKIVGMELWNKTYGFNTFYYNDGYYDNDSGKGYFDEALKRGWKIGAAGSEDNHDGNWGNKVDYKMAILAPKLTKEDLYAALKARRFFSTLDKNLAMSFKINGSEMGAEITEGNLNVEILLNDADNEFFYKVELLKNSVVIKTWNINEQSPIIKHSVTGVDKDYFYIRCKQEDGDEAISSPIFITKSK